MDEKPHIYAIGDIAGNPMLAHKAVPVWLAASGYAVALLMRFVFLLPIQILR